MQGDGTTSTDEKEESRTSSVSRSSGTDTPARMSTSSTATTPEQEEDLPPPFPLPEALSILSFHRNVVPHISFSLHTDTFLTLSSFLYPQEVAMAKGVCRTWHGRKHRCSEEGKLKR